MKILIILLVLTSVAFAQQPQVTPQNIIANQLGQLLIQNANLQSENAVLQKQLDDMKAKYEPKKSDAGDKK